MKPVIKQNDAIYYVSEADMVKFVSINAPMDWNEACDFVRDEDITSPDGEQVLYTKKDLLKKGAEKNYSTEQYKWMKAFFDTHPFIEKIMIVFND